MKRQGRLGRLEIVVLFALLFTLASTVIGSWVVIKITRPPTSTEIPSTVLGTAISPETATMPPIVTPAPSATPPSELPKLFSQAWWSDFFEAFSLPEVWVDLIAGIVFGALVAISSVSLRLLRSLIQRGLVFVGERIPDRVRSYFDRVHSAVKDSLELALNQVIETSRIGEYLLEEVLPAAGQVLARGWLLIVAPIRAFWAKVKAPKWYKDKGAIDPGLIEVSLAVTAIIIALPALVLREDVSEQRLIGLRLFRIASEAIPIGVSVNLIDLYAKDKGSRSYHVLLNPIEDGPFFFLSWAILVAFVIIAAVTWNWPLS